MDSVVLTRLVLLFAGVAIILGFQHYLTMLGTAVLIPLLIIRAIGGEAVRLSSFLSSIYMSCQQNCPCGLLLGKLSERLIFSLFWRWFSKHVVMRT